MCFFIEGFLLLCKEGQNGLSVLSQKKILGIFMYFEERRWKTVGAEMGFIFIFLL